ncbi:MAG: hypothetical protein ACYC4S_19690, partial [Rhodoferax sp.]
AGDAATRRQARTRNFRHRHAQHRAALAPERRAERPAALRLCARHSGRHGGNARGVDVPQGAIARGRHLDRGRHWCGATALGRAGDGAGRPCARGF